VISNYFLKRIGKGISPFWQAILIWLTAFVIIKYILYPPIPATVLYTYMGAITIVIFLFISSTDASWEAFKRPIVATITAETPKHGKMRMALFMVLPFLAAICTYNFTVPKFEEPIELRTHFPAPPHSITVYGSAFSLQEEHNPFRIDENGNYSKKIQQRYLNGNPWDPNAPSYLRSVREGGAIFFQNCHFCHGANLNGQGIFAFAFNPRPVNLADPGSIAQLQETYVFWRVSKGGFGTPREAFPWASAMPAWEEHLNMDEIWKAILFEYWHTGFEPRTWD